MEKAKAEIIALGAIENDGEPLYIEHLRTPALSGWALYDGQAAGLIRFRTLNAAGREMLAISQYKIDWVAWTRKPDR